MKMLKRKLLGLAACAALAPAGAGLAQSGAEAEEPETATKVTVVMTTSMGEIVLELDPVNAPISTKNFVSYVDKGHYDGTIFHRVIPTFMIQGGGFTADMTQKPTAAPIRNEWQNGLKNRRGTIAMARTNVPDSATSQFFINVVDNDSLDQPRGGAAYAVFGKVVQGMDVVDKIRDVPTTNSGQHANVPAEPVIIQKVTWSGAKALEGLQKQGLSAGIKHVESLGVDVSKGAYSTSGLWSVDVAQGEGSQPTTTSVVKVHYTGWLPNGSKFDSSRDRGQPAEFPLNRVIKGWTEGVSEMKAGGKRYLVVPPELGYGERSPTPKIPSNSVLVFEVELLDIVSK